LSVVLGKHNKTNEIVNVTKVLHIVENFNGQATEKWLCLLMEESVKGGSMLNWTFFCTANDSGRFSEKVKELGGTIICSKYPVSAPINFMAGLRDVVRSGGYAVIHSHHDIMSAVYFLAVIGLPIRKRIMHVHNTSLGLPTNSKIKEFIARVTLRFLCIQLSHHIVGVSEDALASFVKKEFWTKKCSVIHCAINIDSFRCDAFNRSAFRKNLGVSSCSLILLFAGRMISYKNPTFVLEIVKYLLKEGHDVHCMFAGEGPLIKEINSAVADDGLTHRVKCLGWRDDILEVMAASDMLIFSSIESPMEGLGLSVIEAQSVGLPVMMSLSVPDEAIVVPAIVRRLRLQEGVKNWADGIIQLICDARETNSKICRETVATSSFAARSSLLSMLTLYRSSAG